MKGIIMFLLFAMPMAYAFTPAVVLPAECQCNEATGLRKTGKTSDTFSMVWEAPYGATSYNVRYYRSEDNYTSSTISTSNTSFTFIGLTPGHYTFYVQTACSGETSGFIGVDDILEN
jgi:hypothetical protein